MAVSTGAVLLYALAPTAATIVGSAIAAVRLPGPQIRSGIQHVAAGVVFAAVAGELLPQVMEIHKPVQVVIGFTIGIALMLTVRALAERATAEKEAENPRGLIVTVGIDLLIDGLLVGIGFAAGEETGALLVVALTLEVLFLGLSTAASLGNAGWTRARVVGVPSGLAILVFIGAAFGAFALNGLSESLLEIMLGFGAAALLYLVTEELLVEAHEVPETAMTTALFFAGFLMLLIIEMAV